MSRLWELLRDVIWTPKPMMRDEVKARMNALDIGRKMVRRTEGE